MSMFKNEFFEQFDPPEMLYYLRHIGFVRKRTNSRIDINLGAVTGLEVDRLRDHYSWLLGPEWTQQSEGSTGPLWPELHNEHPLYETGWVWIERCEPESFYAVMIWNDTHIVWLTKQDWNDLRMRIEHRMDPRPSEPRYEGSVLVNKERVHDLLRAKYAGQIKSIFDEIVHRFTIRKEPGGSLSQKKLIREHERVW